MKPKSVARIRELCRLIGAAPGSASLHPGLYAAARIRELRVFSPGLRPDLCTFARIRELRTLGFMLPFAFAS